MAINFQLRRLLPLLHEQTTWYGEQSVWQTTEGENEVTVYGAGTLPYKGNLLIHHELHRNPGYRRCAIESPQQIGRGSGSALLEFLEDGSR